MRQGKIGHNDRSQQPEPRVPMDPPMPLSNLLKSAAGICRYCGNKPGSISPDQTECWRAHQAGWTEMVELVADAARPQQFGEILRLLPRLRGVERRQNRC